MEVQRNLYSFLLLIILTLSYFVFGLSFSFNWLNPLSLIVALILLFKNLKLFEKLKAFSSIAGLLGLIISPIIILYFVFIHPFIAPNKKYIQSWSSSGYKIKEANYSPFSGPGYYDYEIYKEYLGGFILKNLNRRYSNNREIEDCVIYFEKDNPKTPQKIYFNKCKNFVTYLYSSPSEE